jgi:hypothetical protein
VNQSTREAALRSRFAQAEWLATEIAHVRNEWRLDRHPFLRRWIAGELTALDLQLFAAEHHHAVMALEDVGRRAAALSDGLLAEQLVAYAEAHVQAVTLSCDFASATGWGGRPGTSPRTRSLRRSPVPVRGRGSRAHSRSIS